MKICKLKYIFVKTIPKELEQGVLYISMEYAVAIHKCCCGCGNEVVTNLDMNGWKITIKDETISLTPSIGNFNLPCKSHYYITNNVVVWC